jgi:alkaline phosphatase
VLERDDQAGSDAAIKRIYPLNLIEPVSEFAVISKVLVKDLLSDLQMATNGYVLEKTEGLTVDQDGNVWLINDNDALTTTTAVRLLFEPR